MSIEPTWEPPGPGQWYASPEHLPAPVSVLGGELLAVLAAGWRVGTDRYGLPPNTGTFAESNRWFFYGRLDPGPLDLDTMEEAAADALARERWRADLDHWYRVLRPEVVAENRALVGIDLPSLSHTGVAEHVAQVLAHYRRRAPEHFAQMPSAGAALGALFSAAQGWGISRRTLLPLLVGGSSASTSAEALLDRIAGTLRDAGRSVGTDLGDVEAVGGEARAALDELRTDYAWRSYVSDVVQPTLAERPEAILAGIRAAMAPRTRPNLDPARVDDVRARVPAADRAHFDDLLAYGRLAYGANDDNTGILCGLPFGLARRAVLELGRRLVAQGRIDEVDDAFEATTAELSDLGAGGGPPAEVLAARTAARRAAALLAPPPVIGEAASPPRVDLPPSTQQLVAMMSAYEAVAYRAETDDAGRAAATVGDVAVRGRAVVTDDPTDALERLGDDGILVTRTTTASYNTVFPAALGVAVQHGSTMSHAAVLARELGLPAVIGVPDLLQRVHDGDQVLLDPVAGTISVLP